MDGVVADFDLVVNSLDPNIEKETDKEIRGKMVDRVAELNPDLFHNLPPISGAIIAVNKLFHYYDIYFLSTPMWALPESMSGKRIWIERYFGDLAKKRLILTHRKDLNIGHFLVDDRLKNGASEFIGEHIHFGTPRFPNWDVTYDYLEKKARNEWNFNI